MVINSGLHYLVADLQVISTGLKDGKREYIFER